MDFILYQDLCIEKGFNMDETLVFSLFKWFRNPLQYEEVFLYIKVISAKSVKIAFQSLLDKEVISYDEGFGFYLKN